MLPRNHASAWCTLKGRSNACEQGRMHTDNCAIVPNNRLAHRKLCHRAQQPTCTQKTLPMCPATDLHTENFANVPSNRLAHRKNFANVPSNQLAHRKLCHRAQQTTCTQKKLCQRAQQPTCTQKKLCQRAQQPTCTHKTLPSCPANNLTQKTVPTTNLNTENCAHNQLEYRKNFVKLPKTTQKIPS